MSDKNRGKSEGAGRHKRSGKPASPDKMSRKPRSPELGRALRTIYDDTLRETVPDDFLRLLGKLS